MLPCLETSCHVDVTNGADVILPPDLGKWAQPSLHYQWLLRCQRGATFLRQHFIVHHVRCAHLITLWKDLASSD